MAPPITRVNVPHLHLHTPRVDWHQLEHPVRAALITAGMAMMALAAVQVATEGAIAQSIGNGASAAMEFVQPTTTLPSAVQYGKASGFEHMYGSDLRAPRSTQGYERMYGRNVRSTNVNHMYRSQR